MNYPGSKYVVANPNALVAHPSEDAAVAAALKWVKDLDAEMIVYQMIPLRRFPKPVPPAPVVPKPRAV